MSVDEWKALPWYEAEMYLRGLEEEGKIDRGNGGANKSGGGGAVDLGGMGDMSGLGLNVRRADG